MPTATERPRPPAPRVRPSDAAAGGCLPRKSFNVELKSVDEDGECRIYAAVFGNEDRQGDVIEPGAFDNLEEFVRDGWISLSHDQLALPVAFPKSAAQDAHGLEILGKFHSTPEAQACRTVYRERLAAGKAVKCSIGYVAREESYEKREGRQVRRIKRLSIYEASFVNIPANSAAEATSVKGTIMPAANRTETKRSVAISAANHARMAEFSEEMDGHHEKMSKCFGDMKKCMKAMADTHGEFKEWVKSHEPGYEGEDSREESEEPEYDDPADEVKPRVRKGAGRRKGDEPEDTADGDPPKGKASRVDIARRLAALHRPE